MPARCVKVGAKDIFAREFRGVRFFQMRALLKHLETLKVSKTVLGKDSISTALLDIYEIFRRGEGDSLLIGIRFRTNDSLPQSSRPAKDILFVDAVRIMAGLHLKVFLPNFYVGEYFNPLFSSQTAKFSATRNLVHDLGLKFPRLSILILKEDPLSSKLHVPDHYFSPYLIRIGEELFDAALRIGLRTDTSQLNNPLTNSISR